MTVIRPRPTYYTHDTTVLSFENVFHFIYTDTVSTIKLHTILSKITKFLNLKNHDVMVLYMPFYAELKRRSIQICTNYIETFKQKG